jgi:hypothetical protein
VDYLSDPYVWLLMAMAVSVVGGALWTLGGVDRVLAGRGAERRVWFEVALWLVVPGALLGLVLGLALEPLLWRDGQGR